MDHRSGRSKEFSSRCRGNGEISKATDLFFTEISIWNIWRGLKISFLDQIIFFLMESGF